MKRFHWLYLVAALPILLFALWGVEYGAFWVYLAPAAICIAQFFVPTRLGWFVVTLLYGTGALLYTWVLAVRVWRVFTDEGTALFLDPDEAWEFFAVLATSYGISASLVALSPGSRKADEQPRAEMTT